MFTTLLKGMLAIDLEFSCVCAAINDLAYSFMWIEKKERRRIFLKAYLEAAGFPAESADAEDLGRGFKSANLAETLKTCMQKIKNSDPMNVDLY